MKLFRTIGLVGLMTMPVSAQFGLGMMRGKVGTTFQELNERVKEEQASGAGAGVGAGVGGLDDLGKLQEMMAKAFDDPETMKAINDMSQGLQQAMEEMGKMDPADLQKSMEEAMKLMTNGDILDSIVGKRDEVLANLEQTGLVSADELAKYKADPAYFEEQMRSAFDQMQGLFTNPDLLQSATQAMTGMQEAFSDPVVTELQELLMADTVTDAQIEQMRQKLVANPKLMEESPALAMFAGIADEVKDPALFKKGFLEGRQSIKELFKGGGGAVAGMGAGAGVGEL